ncbi:Uncharacterised protein [Fusobacterium necrophorum subsp. necrophorum]|nr:Uncharacterised protein [Fusobacterium necrophorum subsp. necrophorum]
MKYFKILYAYFKGSLMQQMEYKFNFLLVALLNLFGW